MRHQRRNAFLLAAAAAAGLAAIAFAQGVAPEPAQQPHPHGLLGGILSFLSVQTFVLLFLVVAAGYALGRVKVKGVGLGATAATLLVGLIISVWASQAYAIDFKLPDFASTIFFNLFIFAIGMKVGPQFLAGLRREGKHFIVLAVLVPVLSALMVFGANFVFHLPPGVLPGLLAGSTTATPGLGSAQAAITTGAAPLPEGFSQDKVIGNLTTAYALTYCLSMVLFTVVMKFMPALFRRDAVADARAMEKVLAGEETAPLPGTAEEFLRGYVPLEVRAYRVDNPELTRHSLGEMTRLYPGFNLERVRRSGKQLHPTEAMNLQLGDEISVSARVSRLLQVDRRIGPELDSPELLDVRFDTVEAVVHGTALAGHTLDELAKRMGRGLFLNALFRAGDEIPKGPDTVLRQGDVLRITGSRNRISELEKIVGPVLRPSLTTDIITLALGLSLGVLIGAITVPIGGIKFSLGSAVGLLIVSIVLSILRTHNPELGGPFPEPSRQLLEDLGLNVFIAILGLNAGAGVVDAIATGAVAPMIVVGVLVGLIPAFAAWAVGQYAFKMNSAVLMGAVAGARCNSAGMRAAEEAAQSIVPAVGYAMPFAVSNLLLTLFSYLFALIR
ncbi:TrkA C-terminal domain-containing protein [Myxococcaceae bacterium GXIMD 01537]